MGCPLSRLEGQKDPSPNSESRVRCCRASIVHVSFKSTTGRHKEALAGLFVVACVCVCVCVCVYVRHS